MEEVAFIASSFCFLDSAGNFPSNISRCNATRRCRLLVLVGFKQPVIRRQVLGMG